MVNDGDIYLGSKTVKKQTRWHIFHLDENISLIMNYIKFKTMMKS